MINKQLLNAILQGKLKKEFALFIRDSKYNPVFMRIGDSELFTSSTVNGTVKATPEELDALEQYIEINRIDIQIEQ